MDLSLVISPVPYRKNQALVIDEEVMAYFVSNEAAEATKVYIEGMIDDTRTRAETTLDPGVRALFMHLQNAYEHCNWDVAREFEEALSTLLSDFDTKVVVGRCANRAVTLSGFDMQEDGTMKGPRLLGYFSHGNFTRY